MNRLGLLDWVGDPDPSLGVHFADEDGGWQLTTYTELARSARGVAALLGEQGLSRGGVVSILVPTGPEFATAFFGTLLAGGTPSPLVPPTVFGRPEAYVERTAELMAVATEVAITDESLLGLVDAARLQAGIDRPPLVIGPEVGEEAGAERAQAAELALLQFTSGSSGPPRGVRVTWDNLEANIDMLRDLISEEAGDGGAHWLPLYHDMGLIGCFLTPIVHQRETWIMRPDQFIRDPLRWLERLGSGAASFAAAPNFGFAYATKHTRPEQLEGMDFSSWKGAIVGAERLDPAALDRFARMLEPFGFRREAFLPAYGLAEATLAVSIQSPRLRPRVVRPDWSSVAFGQPVELECDALLGDPRADEGAGWLVGCGQPLAGVEVAVVDEEGAELDEGVLGELTVRASTVASGYMGSAESSTGFVGDSLRTGDAGFRHGGEVFVVGRLGDALKVRGRTLYAEDLESKLCAIEGVPKGRCIVVPGLGKGTDGLVAIVEASDGDWVEEALRVLGREVDEEVEIQILAAPVGTIERTSSGKPRRRPLWRALINGELDFERLSINHDKPN